MDLPGFGSPGVPAASRNEEKCTHPEQYKIASRVRHSRGREGDVVDPNRRVSSGDWITVAYPELRYPVALWGSHKRRHECRVQETITNWAAALMFLPQLVDGGVRIETLPKYRSPEGDAFYWMQATRQSTRVTIQVGGGNEREFDTEFCAQKLQEEVQELKGRLAQNSQNSHRPPSSDPPDRPRPSSLRKESTRKPGGQPGHPGRTLQKVKDPDRSEIHRLIPLG